MGPTQTPRVMSVIGAMSFGVGAAALPTEVATEVGTAVSRVINVIGARSSAVDDVGTLSWEPVPEIPVRVLMSIKVMGARSSVGVAVISLPADAVTLEEAGSTVTVTVTVTV